MTDWNDRFIGSSSNHGAGFFTKHIGQHLALRVFDAVLAGSTVLQLGQELVGVDDGARELPGKTSRSWSPVTR